MDRPENKPATALPWRLTPDGYPLDLPNAPFFRRIHAEDPGPAADFTVAYTRDCDQPTRNQNAAYIVHACNAYPRLVEALKAYVATDFEMGGSTGKAEAHNKRLTDAQEILRSLGEA